jgi:type VI protein secretion system component VasK
MIRRSTLRLGWHAVVFLLFVLATAVAIDFFWTTVSRDGAGPGAVLGFLLVSGGLLLAWRAYGEFRRLLRRTRR